MATDSNFPSQTNLKLFTAILNRINNLRFFLNQDSFLLKIFTKSRKKFISVDN